MSEDQIGRLGYLVLLLVAIGGYLLVDNRERIGKMMQQAAVWGLIFVGVIAAVGLWNDIRATVAPQQSVFADAGRVEVPRAPDGHYYLTLEMDGQPVEFVVDTGATDIVLSDEDARRIGIDPDALIYSGQARTANGTVNTARVRVADVRLGPIVDRDVTVWVTDGEMPGSLLGMSYLQRFNRLEINRQAMVLER